MKQAVIQNDTVINMILADEGYEHPDGLELVIYDDGPEIGDIRTGGQWVKPSPDIEQIRASAALSREDFMLSMLDHGWLDQAEAVADHPDTPRRIKIRWQNAQRFLRMDPDTIQFGQIIGMTEADMDAVFGIEVNA